MHAQHLHRAEVPILPAAGGTVHDGYVLVCPESHAQTSRAVQLLRTGLGIIMIDKAHNKNLSGKSKALLAGL